MALYKEQLLGVCNYSESWLCFCGHWLVLQTVNMALYKEHLLGVCCNPTSQQQTGCVHLLIDFEQPAKNNLHVFIKWYSKSCDITLS